MKRALWITVIALALVALAAIGWVARRFDASSRHEPPRPRRRGRPVRAHDLADEHRRARRAGWSSRPTALAR